MKFLLVTKSRIGHNSSRPADPQAVFKAAQSWNSAKLEDGTIDCVYGFTDGRGGVSVVNAQSHEELLGLIRSSPMYHYMDYEIQPLCDLQELWRQQINAVRTQP